MKRWIQHAGDRPIRFLSPLHRIMQWALAIVAIAGALDGSTAQVGPRLPEQPFDYAGVELPEHFLSSNFPGGRRTRGAAASLDNTPADNAVTNEGATLGRVLFYDKRLSANGTISCSSCHLQEHGFADPKRLSRGFAGGVTRRHSMGLTNARFYGAGKFFWDERAMTLEDQVLMPFQDPVEMGLTLEQLVTLVRSQSYYPPLFEAAFGSGAIDSDRISRALAQFVRSIVSFDSRYDRGRSQVRSPLAPFPNFTAQENRGKRIFMTNGGAGRAPCTVCHQSESFSLVSPRGNRGRRNRGTAASNNGLDASSAADRGVAGTTGSDRDEGRFKSPSLRNVGVGAPYMHDGRFATLEEVVEHYSSGIQAHTNLDPALRENRRVERVASFVGRHAPSLAERLFENGPAPRRYEFSNREKAALVAFLHTLTDESLLSDEKFSDPFADPREAEVASTGTGANASD